MKGVTMTKQELYELKERLTDAEFELEKIQKVVKNLPPEDKEVFDDIIIW